MSLIFITKVLLLRWDFINWCIAALDSKLPNGFCLVPRYTRTLPCEQMIARCRYTLSEYLQRAGGPAIILGSMQLRFSKGTDSLCLNSPYTYHPLRKSAFPHVRRSSLATFSQGQLPSLSNHQLTI